MKRYLSFIIIIVLSGCDLFITQEDPEPDNPPRITNKIPTEDILNKKIGDSVTFEVTASDADDDTLSYMTLRDGIQINDSSKFTFNIMEFGTYLIQIIVFNSEADTAEWQVNVGNTAPRISTLWNITKQEDSIEIGSTAKTFTYSDHEDSLEDLVVELSQTNESLIKLALDNDNNIIVESYQAEGNGSSEITIKVTDSHGAITEKSFTYNITPMTDIEGSILDSDTWEPNTNLQGFAIINGDTLWTDVNGKYATQIKPEEDIDIEAGYRSMDKTNPMSFITTARGVLASNDISDVDIMTVTYLNNNLTPEEFRILAHGRRTSKMSEEHHSQERKCQAQT